MKLRVGRRERSLTSTTTTTSFGHNVSAGSQGKQLLVLLFFIGSFCVFSLIVPASEHFTLPEDTACMQRLLKMEEQFNRRRQNRIDAMFTLNTTKHTERFDVFEPEANCISDERFGSDIRHLAIGDGPKFVCGVDFIGNKNAKNPKDACLVYSIGSNNHIEFEKAVHDFLGCETHTFDPTLRQAFKGGEYSTFHPWGIGAEGELYQHRRHKFVTKSLQTIVSELGHTNRIIDIFKIDCEGCEYEAMPAFFDMIASKQIHVNQIQIELHLQSYDLVSKLFVAADRAGMRIFHKERNGWGCGGHRCLEYSFVSESFLRKVNGALLCGETSTA